MIGNLIYLSIGLMFDSFCTYTKLYQLLLLGDVQELKINAVPIIINTLPITRGVAFKIEVTVNLNLRRPKQRPLDFFDLI